MNIIIFQLFVHALQYFSSGFFTVIPVLVTSSLTACHWGSDIKQYHNRVCRLPQMVQIKGSLTSHSTDKEAAHPLLPMVRTVSPNTPAPRDIAELMPSLRTHSRLADSQEQELQDRTLKASAKQSKHIPAVQLSSNSRVSFIKSYPLLY